MKPQTVLTELGQVVAIIVMASLGILMGFYWPNNMVIMKSTVMAGGVVANLIWQSWLGAPVFWILFFLGWALVPYKRGGKS